MKNMPNASTSLACFPLDPLKEYQETLDCLTNKHPIEVLVQATQRVLIPKTSAPNTIWQDGKEKVVEDIIKKLQNDMTKEEFKAHFDLGAENHLEHRYRMRLLQAISAEADNLEKVSPSPNPSLFDAQRSQSRRPGRRGDKTREWEMKIKAPQ